MYYAVVSDYLLYKEFFNSGQLPWPNGVGHANKKAKAHIALEKLGFWSYILYPVFTHHPYKFKGLGMLNSEQSNYGLD